MASRCGYLAGMALALLLGWQTPSLAEESGALTIPLQELKGGTVRLADFKGKVVLVNFWATWCPPCRDEIPDLVKAQEVYAARGFTVVGVDFMEPVDQEKLRAFSEKLRINYPIVMGSNSQLQQLAQGLGRVFGLPTSILLDREGKVAYTHVGGLGEWQLKRLIEPLLDLPVPGKGAAATATGKES